MSRTSTLLGIVVRVLLAPTDAKPAVHFALKGDRLTLEFERETLPEAEAHVGKQVIVQGNFITKHTPLGERTVLAVTSVVPLSSGFPKHLSASNIFAGTLEKDAVGPGGSNLLYHLENYTVFFLPSHRDYSHYVEKHVHVTGFFNAELREPYGYLFEVESITEPS